MASLESVTRPRHRRPALPRFDSWLHPNRPHTGHQVIAFSGLVLAALVGAYAIATKLLPMWLREVPELNLYVIQPLLWLGLATIAFYGWRRLPRRPAFHKSTVQAGLLVGIFHVSVLVIAGLFAGFGRSGSVGKLINYPLNLIYLTSMLVGLEAARAYLTVAWTPPRVDSTLHRLMARGGFAAVTILLFAAVVPPGQLTHLGVANRLLDVGAGVLVPALVLSGVATWMAGVAGPAAPIGYRGVLIAFAWFSPIVPNLTWLWLLLLGAIVPIAAMVLFSALSADVLDQPVRTPSRREARTWPGWTAMVVTAAVLIAFFGGAFGVRPIVLAGTSMEPSFHPGDLIIVREQVDITTLEPGDIIRYQRGSLPVVHRIVRIEPSSDGPIVTTRGDNNPYEDMPVLLDDVDGKVVFAIPWIGRPALWFQGD
jgi:signal peptidase I